MPGAADRLERDARDASLEMRQQLRVAAQHKLGNPAEIRIRAPDASQRLAPLLAAAPVVASRAAGNDGFATCAGHPLESDCCGMKLKRPIGPDEMRHPPEESCLEGW